MDLQLRDRIYLVVGGAGYVGSAIVDRLRAEGATVVVGSRRAVPTDDGLTVTLDGGSDASVTAAFAAIADRFGRLDGVVVTAAPSATTLDPAKQSDPAQVQAAFEGKAMTFLRVANEAIAHLRQRGFGRIVGISGQNAYFTGSITAAVRNAGLNIAAKSLADDLAGTGITVNVVNPGVVADEPRAEVASGGAGQSSPQQIADLVAFLASPLAVTSGESISIGHRQRGVATV